MTDTVKFRTAIQVLCLPFPFILLGLSPLPSKPTALLLKTWLRSRVVFLLITAFHRVRSYHHFPALEDMLYNVHLYLPGTNESTLSWTRGGLVRAMC